ncbi:YgjV family protein [Psychromonas ossibalaenae]|uniref:YgjV family protein n=1 Tax=Psychromonas ossibalaenae TaxID=444922 RepID=UPI000375205C|nr:YgjV family protein [Psychromonas ossibalaenae]
MTYIFELPFAQWLGLLSFALGIIAFSQKNDRSLKIVMLILNINHMLHYLFLGSFISALSALLGAVRTGTSIYTSSVYAALFFVGAGILSAFWAADSVLDLLPVLGGIIGTISVFMLQGIKMRIGFLLGALCWLINNIVVGSIGGVMLESTLVSVNLLTIYRLHSEGKADYAIEK